MGFRDYKYYLQKRRKGKNAYILDVGSRIAVLGFIAITVVDVISGSKSHKIDDLIMHIIIAGVVGMFVAQKYWSLHSKTLEERSMKESIAESGAIEQKDRKDLRP